MPLEITLYCFECGDPLEAEVNNNSNRGTWIDVHPCETCMRNAKDEVYEEFHEREELEASHGRE